MRTHRPAARGDRAALPRTATASRPGAGDRSRPGGLDPAQTRETRELITTLGKEHTVMLSRHILPEVTATCQRVLIINHGRLVADDTPDNLARRIAGAEGA